LSAPDGATVAIEEARFIKSIPEGPGVLEVGADAPTGKALSGFSRRPPARRRRGTSGRGKSSEGYS